MDSFYSFISESVRKLTLRSVAKPDPIFHLFSQLPPELRRKIWLFALPQRLIEACVDVQNDQWVCSYSKTQSDEVDHRSLPGLFTVNRESREFCLEQYIPLANSYIHPKLDLLYISWYINKPAAKFSPIVGKPLSRFEEVAITLDRNPKWEGRFDMLLNCLRDLGTPAEIFLCLSGSNRDNMLLEKERGFSISDGGAISLLDWPKQVPEEFTDDLSNDLTQRLRTSVLAALGADKTTSSTFNPPNISNTVYYRVSGA